MKIMTSGKKSSVLQNGMGSVVVWLCVWILAGCDIFEYSDPFPDSYYSDNFIASIGFDIFSGSDLDFPDSDPETGEPVVVTGSWDFSYRYLDWDQFEYMRLERATTSAVASDYSEVPDGLSADAPVYRLEVVNLISGGHFESGETGTWDGTGTVAHDSFSRLSGSGSMRLDAESGQEVLFSPDLVSGFSSQSTVAYGVYCTFLSGDDFIVNVGREDLAIDSDAGTATGLFSPTVDGDSVTFQFQPESVGVSFAALYVDDFSMAKSGGMALRLRLRPSETDPALETGTWEFSVWVHADPTAVDDGSTGPYPLESLLVTMAAVGEATLATEATWYTAAENTGWTQVSAILSSQALQFPREYAEADEPVLDLIIEFENVNPGSILLAAPELNFK